MLKSILIDNYALIEELEIDLDSGLSIITGETGAGKSIFLGALGLLLGKRADTSVLNSSEKKCVVEGIFSIEGYGLEEFFRENEVDFHPETIIRREITNSGKSRAFINDTPVNLAQLQELTLHLVDIHSQHQSLSLNSDVYLRWIIDAYAGTGLDLAAYQEAFHSYQKLEKEYKEKAAAFRSDKENLDFLSHQFNELQDAGLKENELEGLVELSSLLGNAEEIRGSLEGAIQSFDDEESGIITALNRALELLRKIHKHDSVARELGSRTESCLIELKDIQAELHGHAGKIDVDPGRLEEVNLRIDRINSLLYKYKAATEKELITIREQLDLKLQGLALSDDDLAKIAGKVREGEERARKLAALLSEKRKQAFPSFEKKILELLHELGMKNAFFQINHEPTELTATGTERIQFLFSANKNVAPQNIARVASGGELSRLMLAIKYLISGASGLPTILFDEIDTGVSGEIADKVGKLIKVMSESMQVINITHLPQVASKGDHHFVVFKEQGDAATRTRMRKLNQKDRLNEIARMLSGDSVTDAAIENARVLLGY
ncbi:MAG: DNA repair protein RecN [Bacteroidales bacterium]|nr:DNA repair protein RecN [Bacteroidales bacterium]